jgi:DnaJ-domain-containing protein 1
MYSEKLEKLIEMALADGVLTEKKKQVLMRVAQAEGVDMDEFEMELEVRLDEKIPTAATSNSLQQTMSQQKKLPIAIDTGVKNKVKQEANNVMREVKDMMHDVKDEVKDDVKDAMREVKNDIKKIKKKWSGLFSQ